MLRKMKKPVSLIIAFLMCFGMMTGIVLPEIAETPIANAVADPYASVTAKMTKLEKADGQVTAPDGTLVTIPEQYLDMDIYAPDSDRVFFFSDDWTAAGLGVSKIGDYFIMRYGDGSKWGNGVVYLMQWGINAFGDKNLYPYTNPDDADEMFETDAGAAGEQLFAAGAVSTGWADILEIARHTTPVIGADNSYDILVFPCTMDNSTGVKGNYNGATFKKPELNDTVTSESELTVADYTSFNIYGPQAGKDPTAGIVGDTSVNNSRSTNAEYEAVFSSTFWAPINATWNFDGIAMSGTSKMYLGSQSIRKAVSGLILNNVYIEPTSTSTQMFAIGSTTNATNLTAQRFHMKNSYIKGKANAYDNYYALQANDLLFENVVHVGTDFGTDSGAHGSISLNACAPDADDTAFLGEYRNNYRAAFTKCTFDYSVGYLFRARTQNFMAAGHTDAVFSFTNSSFKNFRQYFWLNGADGNSENVDGKRYDFSLEIYDNYFEFPKGQAEKNNTHFFAINGGHFTDGKTIDCVGNTFKADPGVACAHYDVYSVGKLFDVSGNLFITHDGRIRAVRGSYVSRDVDETSNLKVVSDVYASADMDYGMKDLFIPQQADKDLLVTYAHYQSVIRGWNTYHTDFGTDTLVPVNVYPENGVTYDATKLFTFRNPNVKYVGTYSDELCTKPVTTYKLNDGVRYGKAVYETPYSKAVVVFIIKQISVDTGKAMIVAPSGTTSLTFNGITYTSSNASFHTTISGAVNSHPYPNTGIPSEITEGVTDNTIRPNHGQAIIIVTPGTYNEAVTTNEPMAIIGPNFGSKKDPTVDGSRTIGNGRGVDPATEAVITQPVTVDIKTAFSEYYCLAGLSLQVTGNPLVIKTGSAERQRFVNVQNLYVESTGQIICDPSGNGSNPAGIANRTKLYVNDSYFNDSTATSYHYVIKTEFAHWNSCTMISKSLVSPNGAYSWRPIDPTVSKTKPYANGSKFTGCTVTDSNGKWYNLTQQRNVSQSLFADNPSQHIFEGNYFLDNHPYLIETYAEGTKPIQYTNMVLRNNYISRATTNDALINEKTTRNAGDAGELIIEGNIIHGYTQPFARASGFVCATSKKTDINENYYGTPDCKVQPITYSTSGYAFDGSWYYVNEEQTVKTTDIEVTRGNFNSVEITDPYEYTANLYGTAGQTYQLACFSVNSRRAEITGLFSDPACENNISSVKFDGTDKTVYLRVKMDNYIATWTLTIKLADVWSAKGFTLQEGDTGNFVDLTAQENYATREGGNTGTIAFVASDWTRWAHMSYDGTTLSDPVITNLDGLDNYNDNISGAEFMTEFNGEKVVEDATSGNSNDIYRELIPGTVFYAQMPTTGVVYKLTYGKTAVNQRQFNSAAASTIVYFPGYYNKVVAYDNSKVSTEIRNDTASNNWAAIGYNDTTGPNKDIKDYVILGPQAGVPAANAENGTTRGGNTGCHHYSAADYKADAGARFATAGSIYWMNGAMKEGGSLTIDGIWGSWGFCIATNTGGGGDYTRYKTWKSTLNINNCTFDDWNQGASVLRIYPANSSDNAVPSADDATNKAKMDITVNMTGCYIATDGGDKSSGTAWAKGNFNQIHLDRCVFKNSVANTNDKPIFYIAPVTGKNNATKTDISYTANDCYIDWNGGYLFGVYMNGTNTINDDTRNKLEIKLTNNYVEDIGFAGNDTRAAIATIFNNGNTASEITDANAITKVTMNHNVFKNTTGAYPTGANYGTILYCGAHDYPIGATITDNIFIGYNNLFKGFEGDFYNNIYQDHAGKFISLRGWSNKLDTSNIVLSQDFTRFATDFDVKAGIRLLAPLSWTPGLADIHAPATAMQDGNLTGERLKSGMLFASDLVVVDDLYAEDGVTQIGDSAKLEIGKTYRLVATYGDDPGGARAVYEVTIEGIPGSTVPLYTGSEKFFDPDVANIDKGTLVVRNVGGTDYQFMVGSNILGTLEEFPVNDVPNYSSGTDHVRKVYLFAKTYFDNESVNLPDQNTTGGNYRTEFYGAKAGISPVAYDTKGAPNGERSAARSDMSAETIFMNTRIQGTYKLDGITLGGKTFFNNASKRSASEDYTVINCQSHPEVKLTLRESNKIFSMVDDLKNRMTAHDNYFDSDEAMGGSYFTVRNPDEIAIYNNVFKSDAEINFFWMSLVSSDTKYGSDASNTSVNVNIYNNYSTCRIQVDNLRTVNAGTGIKTHIMIRDNHLILDDDLEPICFGSYTPVAGTTFGDLAMDGKNTEIEIIDNTFDSDNIGDPHHTYIYHNESEVGDVATSSEYKLFRVEGNTFNNSPSGSVGTVFQNHTDHVWDVSRNTYVGFEHAYGEVDGSVQRTSFVARSAHKDVVLLSGLGEATFEIDGKVFKADDVVEGLTVADVTASDVAAEEGNILTDVATGKNGWTYVFSGKKGMNVKITDADGTVHYNAINIPKSSTRTDAKITFTAQLVTFAGTPVGEEYTVTAYAEPVNVLMDKTDSKVVHNGANAEFHLEGYFRGKHATYVTDLVNKTGFVVTGYGFYIGSSEDVWDDYKLVTDSTVATKCQIAANADGLDNVSLDFAFEHTVTMPATTEAYIARAYMTYKIGSTEYTVLSSSGNSATLTVYVAN